MPYELLVGLDVSDPALYQQYREATAPLLEAAGGGFRYDFEVARTLASEAGHAINRLFTISFRDAEARKAFFADPEYVAIRARLFVPSVRGATILAEYARS